MNNSFKHKSGAIQFNRQSCLRLKGVCVAPLSAAERVLHFGVGVVELRGVDDEHDGRPHRQVALQVHQVVQHRGAVGHGQLLLEADSK